MQANESERTSRAPSVVKTLRLNSIDNLKLISELQLHEIDEENS